MNRFIQSIAACGFLLLWGAAAQAQVPRLIPYQGVYTDTSGNPKPDASYSFTFAIYDVASAGAALWSETRSLAVKGGLFNTHLGEGTAIPSTVKFDKPYWLGVRIGAGTELSPRVKLGSSAYSLTATFADSSRAASKANTATFTDSSRAASMADTATFADSSRTAGNSNSAMFSDSSRAASKADSAQYAATAGVALSAQNGWSMTGNGGTAPGTHYMGTSDSVNLQIRVNNKVAIIYVPTAGAPNIIGGHNANSMDLGVIGGIVAGGGDVAGKNFVTDDYGVVGGGWGNRAGNNNAAKNDRPAATVGGGSGNVAAGYNSSILGGSSNTATGTVGTIGGGSSNNASGNTSTISGGAGNIADSTYSTVGGGYSNTSGAFGTTVAGGYLNRAEFNYGTVGGGYQNNAPANYATVAGGQNDTANGLNAFVGGGILNVATGSMSVVVGGNHNRATGLDAGMVAGASNMAAGQRSFIGAGLIDTITSGGTYSFIGAGYANKVSAAHGIIGGGSNINIQGSYGFVGSGYADTIFAAAAYSAIVGGYVNKITGDYSNIGGGAFNNVSGNYSTVGGGYSDTISGNYSSIPAGRKMKITGNNSFATGYNGTLNGSGSILLCDSLLATTPTSHSSDHRFYARFANGYYFYTSQALTTGMYAPAGATAWSSISDSSRKENFKPVNGEAMLGKLDQFRVGTWNYKGQDKKTMRHYGVMAQELYAAYGHDGIGAIGNDSSVNTLDMDGVNFALIHALEKRTRELKSVKAELGMTRAEVDALKEKIASMEAVLQEVLVKIAMKEPKSEKVRLAKSGN